MAVDWFTGNIYWTDTDLRVITVADAEFNYYKHLINITSNVPAKIAINPIKKYALEALRFKPPERMCSFIFGVKLFIIKSNTLIYVNLPQ